MNAGLFVWYRMKIDNSHREICEVTVTIGTKNIRCLVQKSIFELLFWFFNVDDIASNKVRCGSNHCRFAAAAKPSVALEPSPSRGARYAPMFLKFCPACERMSMMTVFRRSSSKSCAEHLLERTITG